MTQRERILAIAVGSLLVLGAGQWVWNKYNDAVKSRQDEVDSLTMKQAQLAETVQQGIIATNRMGQYESRSLSSDVERARSDYQRWLLDTVSATGIRKPKVDPSPTAMPVQGVYTKLNYKVTGETEFSDVLDLMHTFYAKDYLHQISKLDLVPNRSGGFGLKMSVDVVLLDSAPADAVEPANTSWRVAADKSQYLDPILNRNLFEPPNQPPRFTGNRRAEATVGKRTPIPLTYEDPEAHKVSVELVDPTDDRVTLSAGSSTLQVDSDEKGEIEVLFRLIDQGYPRKSVEQRLLISIVDPPPPPPEPKKELEFDDATQTYLTGMIQGDSEWEAWMNVRTRGTTLKVRVGDSFEVGSIKGTVIDITADFVEIEMEGKRFTFGSDDALREAADKIE